MNSKTVENIQNELIEIHTNAKHSETLHTGVIDFLTRGLVCVRGKNNNIFFIASCFCIGNETQRNKRCTYDEACLSITKPAETSV